MHEKEIIKQYFSFKANNKNIVIENGDDCAVVSMDSQQNLAISCDTMVENTHFTQQTPPESVAHKLITSNLSDLAAMGATPQWMLLSLSIPKINPKWLKGFSDTVKELSAKERITLIGGDTTKSALITVSLTVHGFVPKNQALKISSANAGDIIFVTGELGGSKLGLESIKKTTINQAEQMALTRHYYPQHRVKVGKELLGIATSCTDISDGLLNDLQTITQASQKGALINVENIPVSESLISNRPTEEAIETAIIGGEDYELLFTAKPTNRPLVQKIAQELSIKISEIGVITPRNQKQENIAYIKNHKKFTINKKAFEHFHE